MSAWPEGCHNMPNKDQVTKSGEHPFQYLLNIRKKGQTII